MRASRNVTPRSSLVNERDEGRLRVRLRRNLGLLEITDWPTAGILRESDHGARRLLQQIPEISERIIARQTPAVNFEEGSKSRARAFPCTRAKAVRDVVEIEIRLVSMIQSKELKRAALHDSRVRRVAEGKGLPCGAQPVE